MKFKHSFNVFVDNFGTIYKVLLYRVIVLLFSLCLYAAVIFPFLTNISGTTEFTELSSLLGSFGTAFVNLDFAAMQTYWLEIREAFVRLMEMLGSMTGSIVLTVAIVILVYLVQKFLLGLSNYTAAAMVNDKMAMHAASPFIGTLIKNLGKACLYNAIYVPLSTLYNVIAIAIIFGISAGLMAMGTPILLLIFLASTAMVFLIAIQMTFTSDWLPSLIYAKTTNRGAMVYSFNYISAGNKKIQRNAFALRSVCADSLCNERRRRVLYIGRGAVHNPARQLRAVHLLPVCKLLRNKIFRRQEHHNQARPRNDNDPRAVLQGR